MPINDPLVSEHVVKTKFELNPVRNILNSLLLLTKTEEYSGFGPWVQETRDQLSREIYQSHRLILLGCHYALFQERFPGDFPSYLKDLEKTNPEEIRNRLLKAYWELPLLSKGNLPRDERGPGGLPILIDAVLKSSDAYLDFLRTRFKDKHIDVDLEKEAYRLVTDPVKLKDAIVDHLTYMWENFVSREWEEQEPLLRHTVEVLRRANLTGMDKLSISRYITGHSLLEKKWLQIFEAAEEIIFIPSMHVGPYLGKSHCGNRLYLFFGARIPEDLRNDRSELNLVELASKLIALADGTRLHILQLIKEKERLSSQEIISLLGLSQSAASRHLKQLAATGFINEKRFEAGKRYSLNNEKFEETLKLIARSFLENS
ncbi:MAG: winged helix-turn-helix transcriptional regulator [Spirochaetales bacterium]|nr:winged helix-turn-helix transcriptional regulator [Spirochaetales bacterium]